MKLSPENLHPRSTARVVALVRGWGNTDLTAQCLTSLRRHCPTEVLRVVYVDNGSDPDPFAALVRQFPDVEFVRFPANQGSCRAINAGFVLAALEPHEFVMLMDNDAEIPEGDKRWLERWLECFEEPEVGAAGAVTDYVFGPQQIEAAPQTYLRAWQHEGRSGGQGRPRIPALVSFAVMFRRQALEDIGWLADERFEPGNSEDYDLCLRMGQAGWHSVVAQSLWVHHTGSQTFQRFGVKQLVQANAAKLVDKYGMSQLRQSGVIV